MSATASAAASATAASATAASATAASASVESTAAASAELPIDSQRLSQLYDILKIAIDAESITPESVLITITIVMVEVEKVGNATGEQKKALALYLIGLLVKEIPSEAVRDATASCVKLLGPSIIDALVDASKGNLNINAESCKACCGPNSRCTIS